MLILHDPDTLLHETVELLGAKIIPALESPDRIRNILSVISKSEHEVKHVEFDVSNNSSAEDLLSLIGKTHGHGYLKHLEEVFQQWKQAGLVKADGNVLPECFVFPTRVPAPTQPPKDIYARAGYYAFDMSSGVMDKTYKSIIASANLASEAMQQLRQNKLKEVVALCRPPGHHCNGHRAGGYCYVNNAAVVISEWRQKSPDALVGILDVDFHHGNGTQDIYYSDPRTFYTSIHGADEFPYYTGKEDEQGDGDGVGANLNLPLKTGSPFDQYLEKLEVALTALSKHNPEFLLVSLGFDTFHLDPLGNFKIYTEDYEVMARTARQRLPNVPAVILLEGGYAMDHLGANLLSFLKGWNSSAS